VKNVTHFCTKFIQETTYQISPELPEFYRRYYEKQSGLIFCGHAVYSSLQHFMLTVTVQVADLSHENFQSS